MDGNGAVVSGLVVSGDVDVTASNVTIQNVRIVDQGDGWGVGLYHANNVTISHTEIYSPAATGASRLEVGVKDIYGDAVGTTIEYTNIWHTSTGIQLSAGVVDNNYIHDMGYKDGDHLNGFTSNAGRSEGLTVQHNTIFDQMDQTDAISLFEDFGAQFDATVADNLIAGGSYTLYAGANAGGQPTSNIHVTNNRFSRMYFSTGGTFGPVAAYDPKGSGNTWSGNVWDDTGAVLNHP